MFFYIQFGNRIQKYDRERGGMIWTTFYMEENQVQVEKGERLF